MSIRQYFNDFAYIHLVAPQLSPDPSPRRLAAEVRALTLSHSHLLDQNNRLMQREDKLMETNTELMKQILQLTVCHIVILKEEIQSRSNLISEERVKKIEQNTETWWKLVEK